MPALSIFEGNCNTIGIINFINHHLYNYQAALIWLLVVLVISVLASMIPARNAAHNNVRQTLSYE